MGSPVFFRTFIEGNIPFNEFFKECTYIDGKGETRPYYRVTKKGCEFIAHKLTGTKGTIFNTVFTVFQIIFDIIIICYIVQNRRKG